MSGRWRGAVVSWRSRAATFGGRIIGWESEGEVGAAVPVTEVVGSQVEDSRNGQAEQQDERADGADIQRQDGVVDAAVELGPAVALVKELGRVLARGGWDGEGWGDAAAGGPLEEAADSVGAGVPGDEPAVELVLGELPEIDALLVEPGEQLERDPDVGAQVAAGAVGAAEQGGSAAGPSQQEPVHEGPDEPDVSGGAGQRLVQPGRDPVEGVVAFGQDCGVDEDLADVVLGGTGWQVVE